MNRETKSRHNAVIAALVIGLGLGTGLGLAEGLGFLSKGLLTRYAELVFWSILIDATVIVAFELEAMLVLCLFLRLLGRGSTRIVPPLIGLGIFAVTVFTAIWHSFAADSTLSLSALLKASYPAAVWAAVLGILSVVGTAWLLVRIPAIGRLRLRYWVMPIAAVWLGALLFSLFPALHVSPNTAVSLAADPPPVPKLNVVIVTIDTLRGDSIGLDGSTVVKTPNLDRFGHSGTWFTTEIVQQPNTNASHTSIFTGVFPFVHGVRQHMVDRLAPNVQTLAELLSQRGYATAGLYSWVSLEQGFSGLRGFQTYEDLSLRLTPLLRDPRFQDVIVLYRLLGTYLFIPQLVENQLLNTTQDAVEDTADGKADVTTDGAIRWLDANASKPFFLWVHYYDPHYPYIPPPPFDTMYDPNYTGSVDGGMATVHSILTKGTGTLTAKDITHLHALYDGEISFTDQQVGRLLDHMEQLGLTQNTIVVATADHGESIGTLGRWFHGPRLNYTDIHVPLIFRLPGVIPVNQSLSAPVESIDILPTILDLLQVPTPSDVQGTSLMPLIRGDKNVALPPALSMLDTYQQMSLVNMDWHLIWNRSKSQFELYDYRSDPLELNDTSAQHPDIVAQLHQNLTDELSRLGFTGQ